LSAFSLNPVCWTGRLPVRPDSCPRNRFLPVVILFVNKIKKFEEFDITDTEVSRNISKFRVA
jgi:hypothetical protein